jgi:hypothetical protein
MTIFVDRAKMPRCQVITVDTKLLGKPEAKKLGEIDGSGQARTEEMSIFDPH